jgi:hypothetical protein
VILLKLIKCCFCIFILCFLSGCGTIISINPFYSKKDIVENDNLLGKWKVMNQIDYVDDAKEIKDELWIFSKDNEANTYELSVEYENEKMVFYAVLFKIKDRYFLDLYPKNAESETEAKSSLLKIHSLPVHTISKVVFIEGNMILKPIKDEWVRERIIRKKFNLSYGVTKDDIILLTAETNDIKEFIEKNIEEAFNGDEELSFVFERVK